MSIYGEWILADGLPAFAYGADQTALPEAEWDTMICGRTRRHWLAIGNRRIQAFVDNFGGAALFDEHFGLKWLNAPEPNGTGFSRLVMDDGSTWGSAFDERPRDCVPLRTFGPTWFRVEAENDGLRLERTILCPEGEQPWVLVRVRLAAVGASGVRLRHTEEWALRPRFLNLDVAKAATPADQADLRDAAARHVRFAAETNGPLVRAAEIYTGDLRARAGRDRPLIVFGEPQTMVLEALANPSARGSSDGADHPVLWVKSDHELHAGETKDLWFRFGVEDGSPCEDPEGLFRSSLESLARRLPSARSTRAPAAEREVPWHAAILTGQLSVDGVLGGHALDQGSSYELAFGFNGAARDPLQHALPLVYCEPDAALSVLRNTLAWGRTDGKLAWAIDGAKQIRLEPPLGRYDTASDLPLWAFWLASEYAAVTGDLAAFGEPTPFHPSCETGPVTLHERLKRAFEFLLERIGFGANGHIRVADCDWADGHMGELQKHGLDRETVVREGESVLNSAMAAWVLPVWAGLCDRLGDHATARDARTIGDRLRALVAADWNGRWFHRGRCRDLVVGDETLFLEVQPWAILSGAATADQSCQLLATIDERLRSGSPLGARQRPIPTEDVDSGRRGEALAGGIWPSLQMVLIWAASRHQPELALDEWRRFSLASHTEAYPAIWEGTLSGPDSYNAPESARPGRTWAFDNFAMQQWPVNNMHVHAQPLIAYLRLLGVEPLADGSLDVRGGPGAFHSRTFDLDETGAGGLTALGPVTVHARSGAVSSGPGRVRWR